jgi:thiamine pyrophosphokinase
VIWSEFLKTLSVSSSVDVVGPFASGWKPVAHRPVIFVDGGSRWRVVGLELSSVVVGDGDSSSVPMDHQLSREKDFSDFAFALRSLPQNILSVHAHGFLGERRDHELANLGEAHAYLRSRLEPTQLFFDSSVLGFSAGSWKFSRSGLFSLFVLETCSVTLSGACEYQITAPISLGAFSSFGLSNVGSGEMTLTCSAPAFVFFNETSEN